MSPKCRIFCANPVCNVCMNVSKFVWLVHPTAASLLVLEVRMWHISLWVWVSSLWHIEDLAVHRGIHLWITNHLLLLDWVCSLSFIYSHKNIKANQHSSASLQASSIDNIQPQSWSHEACFMLYDQSALASESQTCAAFTIVVVGPFCYDRII